MNKQQLIEKISKADISDELKQELTIFVNSQADDADLTRKLQDKLAETGEGIIEEVANLQIQGAAEQFNKDMDEVEQDIKQFGKELNQKADQVDMEEARAQIK